MLSATEIVQLHDQRTSAWHLSGEESDKTAPPVLESANDWLGLLARQHRANFDLWHIEDEARDPDATDSDLARVKRRIDSTNQRRNDLAEELDRTLLAWLAHQNLPNPDATLN